MRQLTTALLITALASMGTGVSEANPFSKTKALPCAGDFELRVSVQAVDAADSSEIGLTLRVPAAGRGPANVARIHTENKANLDRARCEGWQRQYWHLVDRMLYENKQRERWGVECQNIARIEYRLGSARETARLCLGGAESDTLAYGFRRFYEGTDGLVTE